MFWRKPDPLDTEYELLKENIKLKEQVMELNRALEAEAEISRTHCETISYYENAHMLLLADVVSLRMENDELRKERSNVLEEVK